MWLEVGSYWAPLAWRVSRTPLSGVYAENIGGRLQRNIRFVRVFQIVLGSVDVRSNAKRSFTGMQIKSTFRISFHSARRLQLPEMRGPRSQISIFCFECCHPACMPAASISVTGNLWDGCQICRRMEGVVILLRIDVKATSAVNVDLHFFFFYHSIICFCVLPYSVPNVPLMRSWTDWHVDLFLWPDCDGWDRLISASSARQPAFIWLWHETQV